MLMSLIPYLTVPHLSAMDLTRGRSSP
jgi:hypothetical protein